MLKPKDEWSRFNRLVGDAIDIIDSADPDPQVNARAIISAMKLNKLLLAEKRASESLSLLIDLSTTPQAIQEALNNSAKDINTIDKYPNEYFGAYVAVVAGNEYEYGEDAGEIIIRDPVVVAVIS